MSSLWQQLQAVEYSATVGTTLLGATAGLIGGFAVLRRRALMGDVMAHAALPGLCLSFMVTGTLNMAPLLVGALLAGLVGLGFVAVVVRWTRTKEDAAIGIALSTFFGAGMMLLAIIQSGRFGAGHAGLKNFIFGSVTGILWSDVWTITAVALTMTIATVLLYKEFKVLSFDAGFARSQGWPTLSLDLTMMGILAVVTVVGLRGVGVVLMAALLITPGAAAGYWTNRLGSYLALAASIGASMGLVGTLLCTDLPTQILGSNPLELGDPNHVAPPGPIIVLCGSAIFVFSMFMAPQRGLLAKMVRRVALARRIARENLMRTMYELSEDRLPELPLIPLAQIHKRHTWSRHLAGWLYFRAKRRGLIRRAPGTIQLTELGLAWAAELTRKHRLWELYLIRGVNVAPDHVDRDADSIEHWLPPDLVARLEAELADEHRLPTAGKPVPISPHAMDVPPDTKHGDRSHG